MLKHGTVDLKHVPFKALIGRSSRENFEDAALVCSLQHSEPVVLLSPPPVVRHGLDQQLLPVPPDLVPQGRRLRVWVPHLGFAAWVWQATPTGEQMIKWGVGGDPVRGKVELAAAGFQHLIGRWHEATEEGPVACRLVSGQVVHAAVPATGSRRVRLWVPRLDVACWVWQASAEGNPMIRWFGDDAEDTELQPTAIVQLSADVNPGVLERLRQKSRMLSGLQRKAQQPLSKGDVALRCAGPGCRLLAPGSDDPVLVNEADVSDCFPPLRLFVLHRPDSLPQALLRRANSALDAYVAQAEGKGKEVDALFGRAAQKRDEVWRDVLDPDLCLSDPTAGMGLDHGGPEEPGPSEWQTTEVDVDADGAVSWASWLNHVDEHRHGALLSALAELLAASLPCLEEVCSRSFRSSRLQVVCRATDQVLLEGSQHFYHVSEWHTDGKPEECVLATAVCYLDVGPHLTGGAVEFAGNADEWLDDASATEVVQPGQGSILAFDNFALRHRVNLLSGHGRRRLVAFHLVDPENRQRPSAAELPRQWRLQQLWAIQDALAPIQNPPIGRLPLLRRIAEFAASGRSAEELVCSRLLERQKRLRPDDLSGWMTGTGVIPPGGAPRIRRGTLGYERPRRTATGIYPPLRTGTGVYPVPTRAGRRRQ